MYVDKTLVKEVVQAIRRVQNVPLITQEDNLTILSFRINDINVRIARDTHIAFQGILFKAFEKMFYITSDFELTMLNEENIPVIVQDSEFIDAISAYLRWRMAVLKKFGL